MIALAKLGASELSFFDLKGLDGLVEYTGASPLHGYTALKTFLPNRRLFGNYGASTRGFYCGDPSLKIGKRLRERDDCPLDANSEWLQRMFPSHAGINLVPNRVDLDFVSRLPPRAIGAILEQIARVSDEEWQNGENSFDQLETDLLNIMFESTNPWKFVVYSLNRLKDIAAGRVESINQESEQAQLVEMQARFDRMREERATTRYKLSCHN